jgi:hypothetical protein
VEHFLGPKSEMFHTFKDSVEECQEHGFFLKALGTFLWTSQLNFDLAGMQDSCMFQIENFAAWMSIKNSGTLLH